MEPRLVFHLIPHTHWDREWYLTSGQFGARLVRMVDELVLLLERDQRIPGFALDGQTVLLEDYLSVRPDQRGRVAALVESGRVETGPWYVLADEQVPAAESLVRNLLLGARDCAALGSGSPVLYSPDAFGHPALLPQLAAEFGLSLAVAWRGIPRGPDLVSWAGDDGRAVALYHLPADGYEVGAALPSDPARLEPVWARLRTELVARAASGHIAVPVGADHHFARPDLVALRDAIGVLEPGNAVRLSRWRDFAEAVSGMPGLDRIQGEQRSSRHTWALQDTHATRAPLKRRNSRIELELVRYAEVLSALAEASMGPELRPLLERAWRLLVQSHFHDTLAGTAHDAVIRAAGVRMTDATGIAREITREALHHLLGHSADRARESPDQVQPSLAVWNPAPRRRSGIVLANLTFFRRDILVGPPGDRRPRSGEGYRPFALLDADGSPVPVQVLERQVATERLDARQHYPDLDEVDLVRVAFRAAPLNGMALARHTIHPESGGQPRGEARVAGSLMENQHLQVRVEKSGAIAVTERKTGKTWQGLLGLEAVPDLGDTYSRAPAPRATVYRPSAVAVSPLAQGPLVAALEIGRQLELATGTIRCRTTVALFDDDPVLRCTLHIANAATDHRLRLACPGAEPAGSALAGTQLGWIRRSVGTAVEFTEGSEAPARSAPGHRFVSVGDRLPVALFAPGFFEYEATAGGDLYLTLLRATGQLSRPDLPTRPGHAGWHTPTPEAQCQGSDIVDLALAVGSAARPDPARLQAGWEDLFVPLSPAWLRDWSGQDREGPSIQLEGPGLALSAMKPPESGRGIILRCFNLGEKAVTGAWRFSRPVEQAWLCRCDETLSRELELGEGGCRVAFPVPGRGVATIRVE